MTNLVQPIAVLKNAGTHEQVVVEVAKASVLAWVASYELPSWSEWLSGPFTKTVRKATGGQMRAALQEIPARSVRSMEGDFPDVVAFEPMSYEEFPPSISKMQVAHLDRPRSNVWPYSIAKVVPYVAINESLDMSTGKTAAQVAHALFAWARQVRLADLEEWVLDGSPMTVVTVQSAWAWSDKQSNAIIIRDAGLTEIEPDSPTVKVSW